MPAPVNALADRIAALLEPELRNADREVVACALLTLAHRLKGRLRDPQDRQRVQRWYSKKRSRHIVTTAS
jgi:hypothetical protein